MEKDKATSENIKERLCGSSFRSSFEQLEIAVLDYYLELERKSNTSAREWRRFHRYGKYFGYRIEASRRYPNLPLIVSIISLLLVLLKPILTGMPQ